MPIDTILRPPSRELERLARRIDSANGFLLENLRGMNWGHWEAPGQAWALFCHCLRQAEGAISMALHDVVLAPSGWVVARASLEASLKAMWLLQPEDPWGRETRWIVLMEEGSRAREALAGMQSDTVQKTDEVAAYWAFIYGVKSALPAEVQPLAGMASNEVMAKEAGEYYARAYKKASQHVHATDFAMGTFRKNLGTAATFGDFSDESDWLEILSIVWLATRGAFGALASVTGIAFPTNLPKYESQIDEAKMSLIQRIMGQTSGE